MTKSVEDDSLRHFTLSKEEAEALYDCLCYCSARLESRLDGNIHPIDIFALRFTKARVDALQERLFSKE